MRVHVHVSEVLVKYMKRYKFAGGQTESLLVRHGTFGFSEYSRLCELNSAWFSSCRKLCSRMDWRSDCVYSSMLVDLS